MNVSIPLPSDASASVLASARALEAFLEGERARFRALLAALVARGEGLRMAEYVGYLSMQVHLTRGVERYFFRACAHPDVMSRPRLREFLYRFGVEEAPHYAIALRDLADLGAECGPMPFGVELWHAYFGGVVDARPFLRLGAACYLENLAGASIAEIDSLFASSPFLRPGNTRFFVIHKHESDKLDHGNEILRAMAEAGLTADHWADLVQGARNAAAIYGTLVAAILGDAHAGK